MPWSPLRLGCDGRVVPVRMVAARMTTPIRPRLRSPLWRGAWSETATVCTQPVAVGGGVRYTRRRNELGRRPGLIRLRRQRGADGRLAGGVRAPVVLNALAETQQPETLVLDSTDFWWLEAP